MSTPLYERIITHATQDHLELAHKVWDPTPWVIDVYVGRSSRGDESIYEDIHHFCTENFGTESWPIHDKPANWYRAGATVDGWTWIGFATEGMMKKFLEKFPQGPVPR